MDEDKLIQALTQYMLENNIGWINITASTNFDQTKLTYSIKEESEDDIQEYGYIYPQGDC